MTQSRNRHFRPLTWLGGHEMTVLLALACMVADRASPLAALSFLANLSTLPLRRV